MSALNRKQKVKCEDWGSMNTRKNAARHQNRREKQKGHKFPSCLFYTKSKEEMKYHTAKKHVPPSSKQSTFSPSCEQEFPSY